MNTFQFIIVPCVQWLMFLSIPFAIKAQDSLSVYPGDRKRIADMDSHAFQLRQFILPTALIVYGGSSFAIPKLKKWDLLTRNEVLHKNPSKTSIDNYTQYFPVVMVYGLNACQMKGIHNFRDRTLIYITSQLISGALVFPAKKFVAEERPDGSNKKSFPSGHAATAFATAHFMYKEYHSENIWLGLAGYPFAVFTGVYRVINNRHWVTDIVAGAGIGIASTELAYWLYPKMVGLFRKGERQMDRTVFTPRIGRNTIGLNMVRLF